MRELSSWWAVHFHSYPRLAHLIPSLHASTHKELLRDRCVPGTVLGDGVYKTEKVPAHLELILGRWLGNRDKQNKYVRYG